MENICVVRLQTEAFERGGTYFYGKTLRVLKRLTTYNLLKDECDMVGVTDALEQIINLHECLDGKYVLAACNFSRDYESGQIDGWDLRLYPYEK